MIFFFRVDASASIGNGHLVRCMTLAKSLLDKKATVVFICADLSDSFVHLIDGTGIILEKIGSSSDDVKDANKVEIILSRYPKGVMVVDHYELNISWHKIISERVFKIAVIDDLANRLLFCHLLINSGCFNKEGYKLLVPDFCEQMLGPEYVIIKPEYLKYRKENLTEKIQRVFIFMGGADSKNMTSRIIESFSDSMFNEIHFDIVIGSSNPQKSNIENALSSKANFTSYFSRPHLADLMQKADLAIGGGGITSWERICIGLPSGIITLAKNQVSTTQYLHDKGLVSYIGHYDVVTNQNIQQFLINEISAGTLRKQFIAANKLCDGLGANRVAKKLLTLLD